MTCSLTPDIYIINNGDKKAYSCFWRLIDFWFRELHFCVCIYIGSLSMMDKMFKCEQFNQATAVSMGRWENDFKSVYFTVSICTQVCDLLVVWCTSSGTFFKGSFECIYFFRKNTNFPGIPFEIFKICIVWPHFQR